MRALSVVLLLIALAAAPVAAQPSLDAARELAAAGRLDQSREALTAILEAGGTPAERVAAWDLLGSVEALSDDYQAAFEAWTEAARLAGDDDPGLDRRVRLRLVERLLPPAGRVEVKPPAPAPAADAEPVVAPTPAPAPEPVVAEPAPPEPSPLAVPERPGEPAPATPRLTVPVEEVRGAVLVAGDGVPTEVIEETLGIFIDYLRERGVDAEMIPSAVWWRRSYDSVSPLLLDTVRRSDAASLVYIDLRFGHRERLVIRCVGADGRQAWQEKVTGGTAFADHRPFETINRDLVERLQNKLEKRIGEGCLPLAAE